MADAAQVKEVVMDVGGVGAEMEGGASTRRRRRGRARRTQKGGDAAMHTEAPAGVSVDKVADQTSVSAPAQAGGALPKKTVAAAPPAPKVIIAPSKEKRARIVLIPKKTHVARPQKTFKAKRISVTIDNTASTRKQRRMTMARVDAMTEDQLRQTAVATKLSRLETVKKVPTDLLRQMLKDYYTMRKMLL